MTVTPAGAVASRVRGVSIARLWANWAALRYGLPRIKPRPAGDAYVAAAYASMRGDHAVTVAVFGEMLREYLADL